MSRYSFCDELIRHASSKELLAMLAEGPQGNHCREWGISPEEWDDAVQEALQEVERWEADSIAAARADAWETGA